MRPSPAAAKRIGLLGEQHAVGGHREIGEAGLCRQHAHERLQIAAQQRLAAGQPELVHAERDEDIDERADLLEAAGRPRAAARRSPSPACSTRSAGCSGR